MHEIRGFGWKAVLHCLQNKLSNKLVLVSKFGPPENVLDAHMTITNKIYNALCGDLTVILLFVPLRKDSS